MLTVEALEEWVARILGAHGAVGAVAGAVALTEGAFGFEDGSAGVEGAATSRGGEFVLAIDPGRVHAGFAGRVEALLGKIVGNGAARLPGARD